MTTPNESLQSEVRKRVTCPHCGEWMVVEMNISICGLRKTESSQRQKDEDWESSLSADQRVLLESATRSGLLDSFRAAVEAGAQAGAPSNMGKFFLHWLKLAKERPIPRWALNEFIDLYPNSHITFHVSQYVGAVVSDRKLVLFLPLHLVNGSKSGRTMIEAEPSGIRQWVKTKFGYIPNDARVFLEAVKLKSKGEFAIPDIGRSPE